MNDSVLHREFARIQNISVAEAKDQIERLFKSEPEIAKQWLDALATASSKSGDDAGRDDFPVTNYWYLTDEEVLSLNKYGAIKHTFALSYSGGFVMALSGLAMRNAFRSMSSTTEAIRVVTLNILDAWLADPTVHVCGDVNDLNSDLWYEQLRFITNECGGKPNYCNNYRSCTCKASGLFVDHMTVKLDATSLLVLNDETDCKFCYGIYPFSPVLCDEFEDSWHSTSDHTMINISDGKVLVYHKTPAGFRIVSDLPIYSYDEIMQFLHYCHYKRERSYVTFQLESFYDVGQTYHMTCAEWGTPPEVPTYHKLLSGPNSPYGLSKVIFPNYRADAMGSMLVDSRLISRIRSRVFELDDLNGIELFNEIFGLVKDYFTRTVADNMMSVQIQPVLRLDEIQAISWSLYFQRVCDKMSSFRFEPKIISSTIKQAASNLLKATGHAITDKFSRFYDSLIALVIKKKKFPNFIIDLTTIEWPEYPRQLIVRHKSVSALLPDYGEYFLGDSPDVADVEFIFQEYPVEDWEWATAGVDVTDVDIQIFEPVGNQQEQGQEKVFGESISMNEGIVPKVSFPSIWSGFTSVESSVKVSESVVIEDLFSYDGEPSDNSTPQKETESRICTPDYPPG